MAVTELLLVGDVTSHGAFTLVPNSIIRSKSLSRAAIGTLAYLLSHTGRVNVSVGAMAKEFKEGRAAISRSLEELETAGFIKTVSGTWMDGHQRSVRFVSADPAVLKGYLEAGEIPFDEKSASFYDMNANEFRRRNEKRVRPRNGKPVTDTAKPPKADSEKQVDDHLLHELISMWNLIKKKGLATHGINHENPSNGLLKAFRKFSTHKKYADSREALKDLEAVYDRLVSATTIHNEPYFRLDWLLTVAPNNGEFAAVKLMEGFYDGGTKAGANGRSQGERGTGYGDAVRSPAARVRNRDYSGIVSEKV